MKKVMVVLCLFYITVFTQDQKHEVSSDVKELTSFHTVIYKLWHTAWPNKDIKMLQSLLPEIEKGTQNIVSVKLPGILREKQTKWNTSVAELTKCVEDYKTAIEKKDSVRVLNSAEKIHSNYEGLVRVIRPIVKDLDQFHQELYLVYNYYMPEKNNDKIIASAKVLEVKVTDLKKVQLPEKLLSKKNNFDKAVLELESSVKKLNEVVLQKNNEKNINASVELVHSKYQEIEKIFN